VTSGDFLIQASGQLKQAGVGSARLDILILLEDATHYDRAWLLAHPEHKLSSYQLNKLSRQVSARQQHQPLAYIRGITEFYGRNFRLNKRVLEPRVESETMIDLLKQLALPKNPKIADVGTGCGAIGITAALEIHPSTVDLYDIDSQALAVARHNEHIHELKLGVHKRDLLNRPARPGYDVVLANLPYVPDDWQINEAAMQEPRSAIFGGRDGLDLYRRLFGQLNKMAVKPKYVLTEALPPQHQILAEVAASFDYQRRSAADFIQVFEAGL
jgi:release factor glutamine methyltransferase